MVCKKNLIVIIVLFQLNEISMLYKWKVFTKVSFLPYAINRNKSNLKYTMNNCIQRRPTDK